MNKPSEAAMRAAKYLEANHEIASYFVAKMQSELWSPEMAVKATERMACAIDAETGIPALLEAAVNVRRVWAQQFGRVLESMGDTNPRAHAIDEAIRNLEAAIAAVEGGVR